MTLILQASLDGQLARLRGEESVSNPFSFGSDESLAWSRGWHEIDAKSLARFCHCGVELARTNKSGRCHLCATRDANGTRPLPADFAEHAVHETNSDLMARYGCCADIVTRWRQQSGVPSKKSRRNSDPAPADFAKVAPVLTKRELRARYHRADPTLNRWLQETGASYGRNAPPPGIRPAQATTTLPPPVLGRAVQAAEFLLKFGPVSRCNADGTFNPCGDHWRRSSSVLCAAEIIARAERQGFDPDAWREVRAA